MTKWLRRIKIKDLLDDREDPEHCEKIAKEIAKRLRAYRISVAVTKKFERISASGTDPKAEVNSALNSLYDLADSKGIWIE